MPPAATSLPSSLTFHPNKFEVRRELAYFLDAARDGTPPLLPTDAKESKADETSEDVQA